MLTERQETIYKDIMHNLPLSFDPNSKVNIMQTPGYINSPVEVHDVAVAMMTAFARATATIGVQRNLGSQSISIDRRHAGLKFNSIAYFFQNGWQFDIGPVHTPINNFYNTKDNRSIFFNGAYPHLREGLLNFLQSTNQQEEIAKKVKQYNSFDLEKKMMDLGLCAAVYRSNEEWLAHPQGQALATIPVIELIKIDDSDPIPFSQDVLRPLEKIKIIDFSHVIAGPTISRTCAEVGADVIHCRDPYLDHILPFDIETSIGKKNTYMDLKSDHDRAILSKLLIDADVFIQGFRPGAFEKMGLGYQDLLKIKKNFIYVDINCYGSAGPWANLRGWEQLAQTASGLAQLHSKKLDKPGLIPAYFCDYGTGLLGAIGVAAALLKRAEEGGSWLVRVALTKTAMMGVRYVNNTEKPQPIETADLERYLVDQDSKIGLLTRVGPVIQFEKTPVYAEHVGGFPGSSTFDLGWGPYPIYPKSLPHRKTEIFKLRNVHWKGQQTL